MELYVLDPRLTNSAGKRVSLKIVCVSPATTRDDCTTIHSSSGYACESSSTGRQWS